MDNLAPTPTQGVFGDVGWTQEQIFTARKKALKKVLPAPARKQDTPPEVDQEVEPEPESDHQLDLLA